MARIAIPLIFGLVGVAILISLGVWQVNRLSEKRDVLASIEARMTTVRPLEAFELPLSKEAHNYELVTFEATLSGQEVHALSSQQFRGAGYRVLSAFTSSIGSGFVDLGFIVQTEKAAIRPFGPVRITGNLLWPDEYDPSFTPDPDLEKNIWFARHVPHLAAEFGGDPFLVVAREVQIDLGDGFVPYPGPDVSPISTHNIPNDHLEYAITWFSLAVVWAGMTAFLIWRIRQRTA